jgi:hypothetical protein
MSDVADIAKTKFSSSCFRHVTKVLTIVLNNINKSFETLIDDITNKYCSGRRLKEEEGGRRMFHVTAEKEGGMFPAFKIKIFQKIVNEEVQNIRTYEICRSTTITTSDVMNFFHSNMNSSYMLEVYFFKLLNSEEFEPKPVKTRFAECLDLLTSSDEYKSVLLATDDLSFVYWYKKEIVLIYLRELRWYLLCLHNKLNFHVQIFRQLCNMIKNENVCFTDKINIGVYEMGDLFFSIHDECLNLLEPNFDENSNDAEEQFTYNKNGLKYFYGNTANCFQSVLDMIAKVFF